MPPGERGPAHVVQRAALQDLLPQGGGEVLELPLPLLGLDLVYLVRGLGDLCSQPKPGQPTPVLRQSVVLRVPSNSSVPGNQGGYLRAALSSGRQTKLVCLGNGGLEGLRGGSRAPLGPARRVPSPPLFAGLSHSIMPLKLSYPWSVSVILALPLDSGLPASSPLPPARVLLRRRLTPAATAPSSRHNANQFKSPLAPWLRKPKTVGIDQKHTNTPDFVQGYFRGNIAENHEPLGGDEGGW